jgi:hypothetical protein
VADSDEIFLALDEPIEVVAGRVAGVLGLEFMARMPDGSGELQYKVRARTFGEWIGVFIGRTTSIRNPARCRRWIGTR